MGCLAGVGGGLDMIVKNTHAATGLVVVDGCDTDCAAKLLKKAGYKNFGHLRVTDLGFEKGHSEVTAEAVERIAVEVVKLMRVGEA